MLRYKSTSSVPRLCLNPRDAEPSDIRSLPSGAHSLVTKPDTKRRRRARSKVPGRMPWPPWGGPYLAPSRPGGKAAGRGGRGWTGRRPGPGRVIRWAGPPRGHAPPPGQAPGPARRGSPSGSPPVCALGVTRLSCTRGCPASPSRPSLQRGHCARQRGVRPHRVRILQSCSCGGTCARAPAAPTPGAAAAAPLPPPAAPPARAPLPGRGVCWMHARS